MKKTTKKLSIKKETVSSFSTISVKEAAAIKGGILLTISVCPECADDFTIAFVN